ncbi:hypothetical protein [Propioniciclava soli]|uniref:Glycosyltransferase n=1 Tax=Propioniciclava soli TaxID=2775081 RepID=A0ABZ3CAY7_9ACTN|nr:hypothetical protein [Propioniciclava soli]
MTLPEPRFTHLRRLTDARALFEHAEMDAPRVGHGYCVDDNARAVVLLCRAADPSLDDLLAVHLRMVCDAVTADGRCHNRLGPGGWQDEPGEGDWWGRATWALGTAAADHRLDASARRDAARGFALLARRRPRSPRAVALAVLGAVAEGGPAARALVADAADWLAALGSGPWPEERLAYDNARLPEALLAAGSALARPDLIALGLEQLRFLVDAETLGDHFSVTPVGGRALGEEGPGFDQQPIELAALADACARAHDLTSDAFWSVAVDRSWRWFTGDNDVGVCLYDEATGAGYDGLQPHGRNQNRGAESTLSALSVLLQARRKGVVHAPARHPSRRPDAGSRP